MPGPGLAAAPPLLNGFPSAFAAPPPAVPPPWGASQTWGGPGVTAPSAPDGTGWQVKTKPETPKTGAPGLPPAPQGGYSLW